MNVDGWKAERIDQFDIRLTAPDGESWCIRFADNNDGFYHFVWRLAVAAADGVKFGCHCDLEHGIEPDGCVLDENRPDDCNYARILLREGKGKKDCKEWRMIEVKND